MNQSDIGRDLSALLGKEACIYDPDAQARYLEDWQGQVRGRAKLVVRPANTQEVAEVVRICNRHRCGIVPQGGNTGLVAGGVPTPHEDQIVVSLERMNRVRDIDCQNYTVTVDAGCVLRSLQEEVERAGRYFPLSLGAEGTCQLGGNLSTNAGGLNVLRYGNARELVLGLEAVLPDGRIVSKLKGLRKDNAGYGFWPLFVGSEGTLGIITAATLKIFPARQQVETAMLAFEDLHKLMELFAEARAQADEFLTAFEMMPRLGLEMALEHVPETRDPIASNYPYYALLEFSSSQQLMPLREVVEAYLSDMLERGLARDGVLAESRAQAAEFWFLREACVEAQRLAGPSVKHDVSVPISSIPRFVNEATRRLNSLYPATRVVAFGHVGDGNVHFNVCVGVDQSPDDFDACRDGVSREVYAFVADLGGSFSAEHGVGQSKRWLLERFGSPDELALMRQLKQALDPHGLFNPGKVFPTVSEGGCCPTRTRGAPA